MPLEFTPRASALDYDVLDSDFATTSTSFVPVLSVDVPDGQQFGYSMRWGTVSKEVRISLGSTVLHLENTAASGTLFGTGVNTTGATQTLLVELRSPTAASISIIAGASVGTALIVVGIINGNHSSSPYTLRFPLRASVESIYAASTTTYTSGGGNINLQVGLMHLVAAAQSVSNGARYLNMYMEGIDVEVKTNQATQNSNGLLMIDLDGSLIRIVE